MRIGNDELNFSDTDLGDDVTSDPIWLGHICNYSIQLVFDDAPEGTFKLQCSNDLGNPTAAGEPNRDFGIENWTDISGSSQPISAAGNHTWQVENAGYRWVRVVWTFDAGSGNITSSRFNVKGV